MNDPVDQQLRAYNDRDLGAFMKPYGRGVRIEDGDGNLLLKGKTQMRPAYAELFRDSPHLHCRVCSRIEVGDWVFTEEQVTGMRVPGGPHEMHAMVAYRIKKGKIALVRLFV